MTPGLATTWPIARTLRQAGIATEVYPQAKGLKKQLQYADKKGFALAVIAGENEFNAGVWQIKNLKAAQQETAPTGELVAQDSGAAHFGAMSCFTASTTSVVAGYAWAAPVGVGASHDFPGRTHDERQHDAVAVFHARLGQRCRPSVSWPAAISAGSPSPAGEDFLDFDLTGLWR